MMDIGIAGFILLIATVIFSYNGLKNNNFFNRYKFEVDSILIRKEYKRLISSGFLHVSWSHLFFNMFSLYAFSSFLEYQIGSFGFVLIYFISLIGGDLLALLIHRQHGDYSAVGASGAICGIIFASIAIFPDLEIRLFLIPFAMPSWFFGILYIFVTLYGIKSKNDNIGHEAHLGGALLGMITAIIIVPSTLMSNYLQILLISIPSIIFIYLIITRPYVLYIDNNFFGKSHPKLNVDHKYNEQKMNKQIEIDRILDKINRSGINSLSSKERKKLDELSK